MLTITISGPAASGKTTYAREIADVAHNCGQTCRIEDEGHTISPAAKKVLPKVDVLIVTNLK